MVLLVFLLVFIIASIILLKWVNEVSKISHEGYFPSNINGREIIGNSELERIRKTVNGKKSRF